ncbi:hypothetical protein [Clostridium algoriphilum]|nr:hypothetical protein [Clostridium algoriphilum]
MNEVKSVLACNDKISTTEKYLKTTNIALGKFTCEKTNINLKYI